MVQPAAMAEPLGRAQGVDQGVERRRQGLDAGHDRPDDGRPRRRSLAHARRAIPTADGVSGRTRRRSITQDRIEGRVQPGQARPVTPGEHDDPPTPADDLRQRQSGPGALAGRQDPEARRESADGVIERLVRAIGGDRDEPERTVGIEASRERVAPHAPGAGSVEGHGPEQLLEERAARLDVPGDELAVDRAVARRHGGNDDVAGVQQPTRQVHEHRPIPWLLLTELPHRPERRQVAIQQSLGEQPGMRAGLAVGAQAGHRGVEVPSLGQQVRDELDRRADRVGRLADVCGHGDDRGVHVAQHRGHEVGIEWRDPNGHRGTILPAVGLDPLAAQLLPHGSRIQWRLPASCTLDAVRSAAAVHRFASLELRG